MMVDMETKHHHWKPVQYVLCKEIPKQHMNGNRCSENTSRRSHHVVKSNTKVLIPTYVPNQEASLCCDMYRFGNSEK